MEMEMENRNEIEEEGLTNPCIHSSGHHLKKSQLV
jgi:hypothetical protein